VGQGVFREKLLSHWGECAVTGLRCTPLLRASHIKPWRVADNRERLDVFNGLLLAPHYDAAFDAGLISFEDTGRILLSAAFSRDQSYLLHITDKARLNSKRVAEEHKKYLGYHRENVFIAD
jgi:predicted restriction endonuclease